MPKTGGDAVKEKSMRVFVLCTGRCGSTAFAKACGHLVNYTVAHQGNVSRIGASRLEYPDQHVEVDNRLSWYLGGLGDRYGNEPYYVHLLREEEAVVKSFMRRWDRGILRAYSRGIIIGRNWQASDRVEVCRDLVRTVNQNITYFLRDKPRKMVFQLEDAGGQFPAFMSAVQAIGNLAGALAEFEKRHNCSTPRARNEAQGDGR